ncbi:glycosyltransferase [Nocardioides sp.]|uniref:glycosyltransferase n=1 Tax=Nocardioides sp. TaxID=35761 RepID=UPI002CD42076|nr:glycosyltransferase [Nocardioides sp.]HSX67586.1 glycosyltransferase [Nocardioides sp.]
MSLRRTSKVVVFPRWEQNPYLTLLTLAAEADGWEITGPTRLEGLEHAAEREVRAGDVVHVHWTAPVTRPALSRAEAHDRVDRFDEAVRRAQAAGAQVLWTVHNEIAHDSDWPDAELRVAEVLARRADRILQLHEHTRAHLAAAYDLPAERLVTLPHSSYAGVYPELPSREEARAAVGVPQGVPTVGLIGQLRPYKGVDLLLEAAAIASRELPDLTVVLAGRTSEEHLAEIDALVPEGVRLVRHHEFLADEEIGTWVQACNVLALPYRRILNSGSALMAATLGRPVILPEDTPLVRLYADEPWCASYAVGPGAAARLAEQVVRLAPGDEGRERAARAFAQRYTPYDMARDYLRVLDGLRDGRGEER